LLESFDETRPRPSADDNSMEQDLGQQQQQQQRQRQRQRHRQRPHTQEPHLFFDSCTPGKQHEFVLDAKTVSSNPALSWKYDVEPSLNAQDENAASWDFDNLSLNESAVPIETMLTTAFKWPWNWKRACRRSDMTWDVVRRVLVMMQATFDGHIDKSSGVVYDETSTCRNGSVDNARLDWVALGRIIPVDVIVSTSSDHPWDWKAVSSNPTISLVRHVLAYPHLPWNWDRLSANPHIVTEGCRELDEHSDLPWSWGLYGLSINPNAARPEIVRKHAHQPWSMMALSRSPRLTFDFVLDHVVHGVGSKGGWNWKLLSRHPLVNPELALRTRMHVDWDWGKEGFSANPQTRLSHVVAHPELPWDYVALGNNEALSSAERHPLSTTIARLQQLQQQARSTVGEGSDEQQPLSEEDEKEIERTTASVLSMFNQFPLDKRLCWYWISQCPGIDVATHVVKNPCLPWDWAAMSSSHPEVTVDTVLAYPHLPWRWDNLSANSRVATREAVKNLAPSLPWRWHWHRLAANPNFTWDDVSEHAHDCAAWYVSTNAQYVSGDPTLVSPYPLPVATNYGSNPNVSPEEVMSPVGRQCYWSRHTLSVNPTFFNRLRGREP